MPCLPSRRTAFSVAFCFTMAATGLAASGNPSMTATSRDIASALIQSKNGAFLRRFLHQYELSQGYKLRTDMACAQGAGASGYAYRCEATFYDSKRSGAPASLQFMVYDRNIDFKAAVASMTSAISRQGAIPQLGIDGTYYKTKRNSSGDEVQTPIPGTCTQPIGHPVGDAICAFEPDPRILMITIVRHKKPDSAEQGPPEMDLSDLHDCNFLAVVGQTYLDTARDVLDSEENIVDAVKKKLDHSR